MKLKDIVPWGRNLQEYKQMFLLTDEDLNSKILGCGDGPSSFNKELTDLNGDITSIDPIYQFSKYDIYQRIKDTSSIVSKQLKQNRDDFIWRDFKSLEELVDVRLEAMKKFLEDYESGKRDGRYIHQELPKLSFDDSSFDLVLSSHFLFLYSEHFDLDFHIDSILQMCKIAKNEVRIFPILDLKNSRSKHLKSIIELLKEKGFEVDLLKSEYEFQKGAFEMLRIKTR
jgi:hypothetical protein